jgi:hypothetical protein
LGDHESSHDGFLPFNEAFVFMALRYEREGIHKLDERNTVLQSVSFTYPKNRIHPRGYHGFLYTILRAPAHISILMQYKHVKERIFLLLGDIIIVVFIIFILYFLVGIIIILILSPEKLNHVFVPEPIETFFPYAPQPVEGHLGLALLQQQWGNFHPFNVVLSSKVIDLERETAKNNSNIAMGSVE